MRVVVRVAGRPWWLPSLETISPLPEPGPEEKFRRLLNAALATPYYSQRERAARLLAAGTLRDLPILPARVLLDQRNQFLNPKAKSALGRLRIPFPTRCGTLMGQRLRLPQNFSYVENNLLGRLHLSETRMLAATPPVLRRITAAIEARLLALPRLSEAVIVLQGIEQGILFPGERDMLWKTLGVPVFEQWLGLDGELIASECGMHQGLHFNAGRAEIEEVQGELVITSWHGLRSPAPRLATGWIAEADTRVCRCGDDRPLLRGLSARRASTAPRFAYACA